MLRDFSSGSADLSSAAILVTGATGSFGRKLVETLLARGQPRRLVVYSRDELKQHEMRSDLAARFGAEDMQRLRFFLGDVRDADRLQMATREIDIIVHAAALKQVPAAEYNPSECIRTNINGAENVVQAALRNHVKQVIALSTDKACNPINLYGATKLASDKTFVAANNLSGGIGTRFAVVRYGNVVGSRGSVVPLFRQLIANGATALPITDERMTRFWITLQQGVDFVLSSLAMMRGGEIFVPKIPSMKMPDLARAMLPGAEFNIIGIRPGEKLHEIMIAEDDAPLTVELADRYVIEPAFNEWNRQSFLADGLGQLAPDRFSYTSENNREQLDEVGLIRLLDQAN